MFKRRKLLVLICMAIFCLFAYLTLHDSFHFGRLKNDVVRVEIFDIDQYFENRRPKTDGEQTIRDAMSHEDAISKATFQTFETPNEVDGFLNELSVARFNLRLFFFDCKCRGQHIILLTYSDGSTRRIGLAHTDSAKLEGAFGDLKLTASSCDLARRIARNAELAFDEK